MKQCFDEWVLAIVAAGAIAVVPAATLAAGGEPQSATMLGENPDNNFGKSVTCLGDVNGDGFDDFAIGAPYVNNGRGAVYVFFGSANFFTTPGNPQPNLVLHGQAAGDQFGISISGDVDLNGSGYADIVVGARFSDAATTDGGAVFIYFGGEAISTTPSRILADDTADDWFANSVSSAGDVNDDGLDDLIVGAPYNSEGGNAAGKAYIYFGGANMDDQPDVELFGAPANHSHFGWSVSGAGDVNGDGFDDVIVGARLHGSGPSQARGRAYIFYGGSPMNGTADLTLEGEVPHDWFGESVSGAGDVNGDGYDDVIIGAHFADPNGSASGKAYVYFGGAPMSTAPAFTFAGPHADAQLGFSVSGAGDVNGDSYADLTIGAHFANGGAGESVVIFGSENPVSNAADFVQAGTQANEQFGASVSSAGRITGQSPAAFLAGAPLNSENGSAAGRATTFRLADDDEPGVPGDLDGNGVVNVADLLILLGQWGDCANCDNCAGDLDGNCAVGVSDLLLLLANWG